MRKKIDTVIRMKKNMKRMRERRKQTTTEHGAFASRSLLRNALAQNIKFYFQKSHGKMVACDNKNVAFYLYLEKFHSKKFLLVPI